MVPIGNDKTLKVLLISFTVVGLIFSSLSGGRTSKVTADSQGNFTYTVYHVVLESELRGFQTATVTTSQGESIAAKASFLYGLCGVAQQGTGRLGADDRLIRWVGGIGTHVALNDTVRSRYAALGITDFTGFDAECGIGGVTYALEFPASHLFSVDDDPLVRSGATGRVLTPEISIAVDP